MIAASREMSDEPILITIVAHSNGHVFVKKVYDVFMNLKEDKNNY